MALCAAHNLQIDHALIAKAVVVAMMHIKLTRMKLGLAALAYEIGVRLHCRRDIAPLRRGDVLGVVGRTLSFHV